MITYSISTERLTKRYGGRLAVDTLDFPVVLR
jgi:hypothetical protein